MASGPPPGMNLNDDRRASIIGPVIALMAISASAVAMRIASRVLAGQRLLWDDHFAVVALVSEL